MKTEFKLIQEYRSIYSPENKNIKKLFQGLENTLNYELETNEEYKIKENENEIIIKAKEFTLKLQNYSNCLTNYSSNLGLPIGHPPLSHTYEDGWLFELETEKSELIKLIKTAVKDCAIGIKRDKNEKKSDRLNNVLTEYIEKLHEKQRNISYYRIKPITKIPKPL